MGATLNEEVFYMKVYVDNAATTKISKVALDAMLPCFADFYGNPSSLHTPGQEAKEALENARKTVADCLGCWPRENYFTSVLSNGGENAQALM
jgi:cysteine desulfurase